MLRQQNHTKKRCFYLVVCFFSLFVLVNVVSFFFHVFSNVCQAKVSFNHLVNLYSLLYRFEMHSVLFLVTASTFFHSAWTCKFPRGWLIQVASFGHASWKRQTKRKKKTQTQNNNNNKTKTMPSYLNYCNNLRLISLTPVDLTYFNILKWIF